MNNKLIKIGFILAGAANIGGVLLFSKLFNNPVLNQADPVVMSNFGLVAIILWGLCYWCIAAHYRVVPYICLVFAMEKALYVGNWLAWLANDIGGIVDVYKADLLAGMFYTIYGLNDIVFMIFFAYVFIQVKTNKLHD